MTDLKDPKVKKPVRYMDFVSHKPKANADPLASRPASRPVEKPKPIAKPKSVADQIPAKDAHTPKIVKTKEPELVVKKTEQKPYISREPAKSRDLYLEDLEKSKPAPAKDDLALKASAALSGSSKPAEKPSSAPDGNAYSLGGKSPFLSHYKIDKRPLSNSVPAKKPESYEKLSFLGVNEEPTHHKNIYDKKSSDSAKTDDQSKKSVRIVDDSDKKRGFPVWAIIIVTILLGAAVGAGVYFLLPK